MWGYASHSVGSAVVNSCALMQWISCRLHVGVFQEFNAPGLTQAHSSDQVHLDLWGCCGAVLAPQSSQNRMQLLGIQMSAAENNWSIAPNCDIVPTADLVAHNSVQAHQTFLQVFIPSHCRVQTKAGRRKAGECKKMYSSLIKPILTVHVEIKTGIL